MTKVYVTRNRLKVCSKMAKKQILAGLADVYTCEASKELRGKETTCDIKGALQRLDSPIVYFSEDNYGETDGDKIWITNEGFSEEFITEILVHEAMHDLLTMSDESRLSAWREHRIMERLGYDADSIFDRWGCEY